MIEINLTNKAAAQTTVDFNSMCKFGDRYLGASSSGIFEIDGYNDNGTAIQTLVKSGKFDLGSERRKRFRFFYFGLETDGELTLSIFADDVLAAQYDVSPEPTVQLVRVPISRETNARYWQWQIENVSGAFFSIYDVKAIPIIL
jgi:hypothetical protein